MLEELPQDLLGHGAHVRPHTGGVHHVLGVTDGGDEDLGGEVIVLVDRDDVFDEPHTLGRDVVEPPHEGGDVGRARLRGQERLGRREAQGDVRRDALLVAGLTGLQPRLGSGR